MRKFERYELRYVAEVIEKYKEILDRDTGIAYIGSMLKAINNKTLEGMTIKFLYTELGINAFDPICEMTAFTGLIEVDCFDKIIFPDTITDMYFMPLILDRCTASEIDMSKCKSLHYVGAQKKYIDDKVSRNIILPDNIKEFSPTTFDELPYTTFIYSINAKTNNAVTDATVTYMKNGGELITDYANVAGKECCLVSKAN